MANQDPQPEVYTTSHQFAGAVPSGTSNVISIFTNQANNEEVRLYAIGIEMLDATTGGALAADLDYSVVIHFGLPLDVKLLRISIQQALPHPHLMATHL